MFTRNNFPSHWDERPEECEPIWPWKFKISTLIKALPILHPFLLTYFFLQFASTFAFFLNAIRDPETRYEVPTIIGSIISIISWPLFGFIAYKMEEEFGTLAKIMFRSSYRSALYQHYWGNTNGANTSLPKSKFDYFLQWLEAHDAQNPFDIPNSTAERNLSSLSLLFQNLGIPATTTQKYWEKIREFYTDPIKQTTQRTPYLLLQKSDGAIAYSLVDVAWSQPQGNRNFRGWSDGNTGAIYDLSNERRIQPAITEATSEGIPATTLSLFFGQNLNQLEPRPLPLQPSRTQSVILLDHWIRKNLVPLAVKAHCTTSNNY